MTEGVPAQAPEPLLREPRVKSELGLVQAIEAHCVKAWPAASVEHTDDGWVLRATPGLPGRGRSNHALPPLRELEPPELDAGLERAAEFAARHGIECGLQISPTDLHAPLIGELERRGWRVSQDVLVMAGDTQAVAAGADSDGFDLVVCGDAAPEWVEAWVNCDRRADVQAHLENCFPRMAGIARFAHSGNRAVGISVEIDGIVGLYCLAVDPEQRRQGLGKALVRAMLAQHAAPLTYLQVFGANEAGLALYHSLGFAEVYRYRHALAPVGGGVGIVQPSC